MVPTTLALIRVSTAPGSEQRFNQLCGLLGDGIIGSVWLYASENEEAVLASVEVLPTVVRELGIGSARYLKVCPAGPLLLLVCFSEMDTLGHDHTARTPAGIAARAGAPAAQVCRGTGVCC